MKLELPVDSEMNPGSSKAMVLTQLPCMFSKHCPV